MDEERELTEAETEESALAEETEPEAEYAAWQEDAPADEGEQEEAAGEEATGYTAEDVEQMLAQSAPVPAELAARANRLVQGSRLLDEQMQAIHALDPEVQDVEDLAQLPPADFARFNKLVQQGLPMADAYRLVSFDRLTERAAGAAQQRAINAAREKQHLKATGGGAGESVAVPSAVYAQYRAMLPGWSDAKIRRHYKQSLRTGA